MFNPGEELSSIAFDKIIGGALNAVVSAQNNSSLTTVEFIKSVGFERNEEGNPIKPIYVDFKYPKEVKSFVAGTLKSASVRVKNGGSGYTTETTDVNYNVGDAKVTLNFQFDSEGTIIGADIVSGADNVKGVQPLVLKSNSGKQLGVGAELEIVEIEAHAPQAAIYQDMTLQVPILTMLPIPFIRVATTDIELNVKINSISSNSASKDTSVNTGIKGSASYRGIVARASIEMNTTVAHQSKSASSEEVKKEYSLNIKIHAVQDEMPAGLARLLDVLEESVVPKSARSLSAPKATQEVM